MSGATIQQVAAEAGTSTATISRVLNNDPTVNAKNREKALKAIERLGYQRQRRQTVSLPDRSIAVVVANVDDPFTSLILKGILGGARHQGYKVNLFDSATDPAVDEAILQEVHESSLAGLIYISSRSESVPNPLIESMTRPVVLLDRLTKSDTASSVTADNFHGAYQVAKYLIDLGHRRILFLGGPRLLSTQEERLAGFRQALSDNGISFDDSLILDGGFSYAGGHNAITQILPLQPEISAIFSADDVMALGARQALEENGIRIPGDISLTGFNDIGPSVTVGLTTVNFPVLEMGQAATRLVIDLIEGRFGAPQHIILRPNLVIRTSCRAVYSSQNESLASP
jgi:LacI family transcriptional regulator